MTSSARGLEWFTGKANRDHFKSSSFLSSLVRNPANEMKGFFCEMSTQACLKQLNYVSFIQVIHKFTTCISFVFQAGAQSRWSYSLVETWGFSQHLEIVFPE